MFLVSKNITLFFLTLVAGCQTIKDKTDPGSFDTKLILLVGTLPLIGVALTELLKIPLVTGFMYGDEYLKLETVIAEELRLKTYINKTTDNLIIL